MDKYKLTTVLDKMKLQRVSELTDNELILCHTILHGQYDSRKNRASDKIVTAHEIIVEELKRRGRHHHYFDGLDEVQKDE